MKQSDIRSAPRRIIALALVAACAGAVAGTATAAAPDADAPGIAVKYGDLNLGTEAGVHVLYRRLVGAAGQVCGVGDSRDPRVIVTANACRDQAVLRAVHQVGSPRLAALAAVHSKAG